MIQPPLCQRCGHKLSSRATCNHCAGLQLSFSGLRSWAYFDGPLRNAIHRLKYKGDISLGEILSRPMSHLLQETNWKVDLVTAVPLGVARQAERGYNQATLLARPLALAVGFPFRPAALNKVRDTHSQVGLNAEERKQNVKDAFMAKQALVGGLCVVVVDDVTTTGATIDACAKALLAAGARQVFGLTLAQA